MKKLIKSLKSLDLQPGMILAEDFIVNGVKLLTKDMEISYKAILKITNQFPEEYLEVYCDDNINYESLDTKKEKIEKNLTFLTNITEKIFFKIRENDKIEINDVRNLSDMLLNTKDDFGLILKSIIVSRKVDEYTFRHSVNTAALAVMLGRWLDFSERSLRLLCYSGLLHDVGKSKIRPEILNKKGPLTHKEYKEMKGHAKIGYDIVKKIPYIDNSVSLAVLMHHEREDGSGYPLKLNGDSIHTFGKIIAIVDTFDAMTSNRVYRNKISPLNVLKVIKEESFSKLDPVYCNIFITNLLDYYIGDNVVLSNGKIGKIIKMDINDITCPLVKVDSTFFDLSKNKDITIQDML